MPTPTTTQAAIETAVVVTLETISDIDAAVEVQQPAPVNVGAAVVDNKLSIQSVSAPADVTYDQVYTTDEVTNESLNRTAESLAADINAKLGTFASTISTALTDAGTDLSAQVSEINRVLGNLRTDINAALEEVRTKELEQTSDITAAFNSRLGKLTTNIGALKTGIKAVDDKLIALDSVYGTDSEIAAKVTAINNLIEALRGADLDVVAAIDGTIDEVNSLTRVERKVITVTAGSGERAVDCLLDGFGEFAAAADYVVSAEVHSNKFAQVDVMEQTAAGFKLVVRSAGKHFVPQPVDCSVSNVDVIVTVTHAKRDPLTFNIDQLNSSFVTSGNGTDATSVGA